MQQDSRIKIALVVGGAHDGESHFAQQLADVVSRFVPDYEPGRQFRDLASEANQLISTIADLVLLVFAGLPFLLKEPEMAEFLQ